MKNSIGIYIKSVRYKASRSTFHNKVYGDRFLKKETLTSNVYFDALKTSMTATNAALYVVFGFFTYLGIFVYGVRFWPAVIVPAVFAVLFGRHVGSVGAAIGIFLADVLIHGNALLSITVGVPANFIAFWIIGYAHKNFSWKKYFFLACAGLAAGSAYIGIGLWVFSHFFISFLGTDWGIVLGLSAALWTFVSEIPFLIIVVPIVVKACHQAFPELLSGNSDIEAG
jgi:hypothetical protein